MEYEFKNSLIYLVDDDPAILDSLTILIKPTGLKTISFESAEGFLAGYDPDRGGCLVLDIKMPTTDGLELQETLSKENIRLPIIFISGNAQIPDAAKAFKAGAVDFLAKPFDPNQLMECIFTALKTDNEERQKRLGKEKIDALFKSLSAREKEVLQLTVNNHSSKQAAKKLGISYRTVEAHRLRIMEKLQTKSSTELVAMALTYSLA